MQVTVYLDIIFLINFCVSFYVMLITGWLTKAKISLIRISIGALLESLILLPLILHPRLLLGVSGVIFSIIISMGTIIIVFWKSNELIKKWFLSTTVMIMFGGLFQLLKNILFPQHFTFYIWIISFLLTGLLLILIIFNIINVKKKSQYIYRIRLIRDDKIIENRVFLDTGNRLRDSLLGRPVMLLSEEIAEKILTDKEINFVKEYKKKGYIDYQNPIVLNSQKNICFHEIAYKSVGKTSGRLLCFIVESVEIEDKAKVLYKQPVAIVDDRLFDNKCYKGLIFSDEI